MTRVILCCLLIIVLWATHAAGNTWYILPDGTGDAPNIQAAIDAGSPGDTLLLAPGTFTANDTIVAVDSRVFWSEAGPEQTTIQCESIEFGDWGDYTLFYELRGLTIIANRVWMLGVRSHVEDCIIGPGGFIANHEGSHATVEHSTFLGAGLSGIRSLIVSDCTFRGEGARIATGDVFVTISRCSFYDGSRALDLGAMSYADVSHCEFARVAVFVVGTTGDLSLDSCYFHDNNATLVSPGYGTATVTGSVFARNTGRFVRAVLCPTVFAGNTIVGNIATQDPFVESISHPVTFRDNIIAFNSGPTFSVAEPGKPPPVLTDNDLFGNQWGDLGPITDGGGNFSADPWFCNPFQDDYTLQQGSPCLADNSPTGTLVGALGLGCEAASGTLRLRPRATNTQAWDAITAVLAMDGADTIDPSTVRLNGLVAPLLDEAATTQPAKRGEGGPILPVRPGDRLVLDFDLDELMATFATDADEQRVTLTAQLGDGTAVRAGTTMRLVGLPGAEADPEPATDAARVVDGFNAITPNPFNPVTRIRYGVTAPGRVQLVVYDVAGRRVSTLVDTPMPAGIHQVTWDAAAMPSGIYFARLTTPQGTWTRKLVVVK